MLIKISIFNTKLTNKYGGLIGPSSRGPDAKMDILRFLLVGLLRLVNNLVVKYKSVVVRCAGSATRRVGCSDSGDGLSTGLPWDR